VSGPDVSAGGGPDPGDGRGERLVSLGVLGVTVLGLLALIFEQVRHPMPFLNDGILHFGMLRAMADAPARGQSILDPWVGTWGLGFPAFHYYQNLPHLTVLALWKLSFGTLSLVQAFKILEWLAPATFPIPVYLAARKLGFRRAAAAAAGVIVVWTRTNYLHGLALESYVWQGLGQFAQAFGGWFFPLALAWTYTALREGRGLAKAAVLLTVTFLSHLGLGYMAFLAAGILALLSPKDAPRRVARVAIIAAVTVAASSYMVVPILRDFAWYNVSDLVPTWKYDSFGAPTVLRWLVTGELFDYGRWPIVTGLVGIGLVWTIVRTGLALAGRLRQSEAERFLLVTFVVFLLLFFGRPTWGRLLDYLPLGSGFHWSRVLFVVQLTGTMLGAIAVVDLLARLARKGRGGAIAVAVACLAVAALPVRERVTYLGGSADLVREAAAQWKAERADLDRALDLAAEDRMGRVYAGQGAPGGARGWGGRFMVGWTPVYDWFPIRNMDALGYLHHMWSLNSDFHNAWNEANPVHYHVFNVRRILAPPEVRTASFAHEMARFGRFRVLEVNGPGFVELVDAPYRVDVPKSNVSRVHRTWLAQLAPQGIHPLVRIVFEGAAAEDGVPLLDGYDVHFPQARIPPGPRGEVLSVERHGDDFAVDVRADRPCHLVLKMTYHSGWRATLDGAAVRPEHLLPSFLGVPLPPGTHRVTLRWDPGPLKGILALSGLAVLAAFCILARRIRL